MTTSSDQQKESLSETSVVESMSRHDLLASLAIMKGYGKALDDSFSQLKLKIEVLAIGNEKANDEVCGEIAALEAECAMFISRLRQSSEQISAQLSHSHA